MVRIPGVSEARKKSTQKRSFEICLSNCFHLLFQVSRKESDDEKVVFALGVIGLLVVWLCGIKTPPVSEVATETFSPCLSMAMNPQPTLPSGNNPGKLIHEAVASKTKLWTQKSTVTRETGSILILKVLFLDGTSAERARVKRVAPEWSKHANIRFQFVERGASDMRIGFDPTNGHWSYIGTDAGSATKTMNLALRGESERRKNSVISHEFGHALGLVHEHQNPALSIQWNESAVIAELRVTQKWSEDRIRRNVLNPLNVAETNYSAFDRDSIMIYAIPNRWTIDNFETDYNTELSAMDKRFIAAQYGGGAPPYGGGGTARCTLMHSIWTNMR